MINKVKEYRLMNNLTQEELARKIDISLRHFQNIESANTMPSVEIALKIAKVLDVDVKDLFIVI